jgi:hypothetical protein
MVYSLKTDNAEMRHPEEIAGLMKVGGGTSSERQDRTTAQNWPMRLDKRLMDGV